MTRTPEDICRAADAATEGFAELATRASAIASEYAQKCGMPADFRNPFDVHYELERLVVDKIQREAAVHVIGVLQQTLVPNVPIDAEQILRAFHEQDRPVTAVNLLAYIRKEYTKDAAAKSRDAIHKAARRLLPHAAWKEEINIGHMLKGSTLMLRKYIHQSYGAYYSNGEDVDAFQKLVRLVMEDADPVSVDIGPVSISALQHSRKNDELFQEIVLPSGHISKVRFFKNGKLLATFKASTAAQRVAEALLQKPADN
jgi:hypothetical protein